jgi:5'-3' exonuclease
MTNYILIDGSYFIFYRFYALHVWWKNSHRDEPLDNPIENPEFVEKFRKTFVDKLLEIPKKLKLKDANAKLLVGRDCPRADIWRNEFIDSYKGTRDNGEVFLGGPFFKMVYEEKLFEQGGVPTVFYNPLLEADDCLALATRKLLETDLTARVWIIASDMDYLQLAQPQIVTIMNLKYKDLTKMKSSMDNADCDLFCKILTGDKSDNIPGVFKKCGPKTALKYYNNRVLLEEQLNKNEGSRLIMERNRKIIDFREIPAILQESFFDTYGTLFEISP